jgi:hypothetical protein
MGTGGVAVCCVVSQFAVFARIERPQGEWQRLLSVAEIGGVKVPRRISLLMLHFDSVLTGPHRSTGSRGPPA